MPIPDCVALDMFQFAGCTLDIARYSLRAADREVPLRRKSFEFLRYLVEKDRLVSKEELLKAIWPNVVVTAEVLTQCVSEVRQAIGDNKQTIIVTVPRRGHRFVATVSRIATDAAAAPRPAPPTPTSPPTGADSGPRSQLSLDRPSVVVLPFANLNGDPQEDYFSDGITEDITTELSRFSELIVIARNSAFQYKGKAVDVRQVGRELGRGTYSGATAIASASRRSSSMPRPPPTVGPSATTVNFTTYSRSRTRWCVRLSRPSLLM